MNKEIDGHWQININEVNESPLFAPNSIRTSKYTWLTFLPKNLMEQFSKMANVYFLFIMVLQCIPPISISNGQPAILFPLAFVITVSAIKDIFEDRKRHKSDDIENNTPVEWLNPKTGKLETKKWQDLRVGQVAKINCDEYFPADMVLLMSSGSKGISYIETKNLDGETNLKHKSTIKQLAGPISNQPALAGLRGTVQYEKPNDKIYQFEGVLELKHALAEAVQISITHDNFLLRGSSLRNTDHVFGLVVFTGHDTKIMKNSAQARFKKSRIDKLTNRQILYVFIMQVIMCLTGGIIGTIWLRSMKEGTEPYLHMNSETDIWQTSWFLSTLQRFGTWILIFT